MGASGLRTRLIIIGTGMRLIFDYCYYFIKCSNIGDEWLVTDKDTESYIPDVTEVGTGHQMI